MAMGCTYTEYIIESVAPGWSSNDTFDLRWCACVLPAYVRENRDY
jgi:hypothetical protein